jgi:hypothetical protein
MAAKKAVKKKVAPKSRRKRSINVQPLEIRIGGSDKDLQGLMDELNGGNVKAGEILMDRAQAQAIRDDQLRHDNVMTQAQSIIYGEREKTYGRPEVNLQTIAEFWRVYLERKEAVQGSATAITIDDVCQMMVFMKSGRLLNEPGHHDSQVDQIGYIALQERCRGR